MNRSYLYVCLLAIIFGVMPVEAYESSLQNSTEGTGLDEPVAKPIIDKYGRQLFMVYLDEHLIGDVDITKELPMRLASDSRNQEDWRGWHQPHARAAVARIEQELNIEAISMTSHLMPTFSAFMDEESVRKLKNNKLVVKVDPAIHGEEEYSAMWTDYFGGGQEIVSWGKLAIGTNDSLSTSNTVYMIDGNLLPHVDLTNVELAPVNLDYLDGSYHASHVAGIIGAKDTLKYSHPVRFSLP